MRVLYYRAQSFGRASKPMAAALKNTQKKVSPMKKEEDTRKQGGTNSNPSYSPPEELHVVSIIIIITIIMNALKVLKPSRSFLHERWAFPSCINQFRFWLYSK